MTSRLAASFLLIALYMGLSFFMDPRGFLGTDTGGKVATLEVMKDRGSLDPDVGYWAERWDPEGVLHPLYYTFQVDHDWVNVTTLPMIVLAQPLYSAGGYRAALLLPMLGAVAVAHAARHLSLRLRPERDWWSAYWITALCFPVVVYALDLWEHSLGLAFMAWGFIFVDRMVEDRTGSIQSGLMAGGMFGAAATMRSEALVYWLTSMVVAAIVLLARQRRLLVAVTPAVASAISLGAVLGMNFALELLVVGGPIRAPRSTGTISQAGLELPLRLREALTTTLSLQPSLDTAAIVLGSIVVGVLFLAAASAGTAGFERLFAATFGIAVGIVAWRMISDLGFVPGMLPAVPLAIVGVVHVWRSERMRVLATIAIAALPLVWFFQFRGGATAQWAGRYQLPSAFLLAVLGICSLERMRPPARVGFVGLAAAMTAYGVLWLGVRSHLVGDAGEALSRRPEPVLIARMEHLPRELGAFYGEKLWLAAPFPDQQEAAVQIVRDLGYKEFGYVASSESEPPPEFEGFHSSESARLPYLGVDLVVTTYRSDR